MWLSRLHLLTPSLAHACDIQSQDRPSLAKKRVYFEKIDGLLKEYSSLLIVHADNVSSRQMQDIRISLRGRAVLLFGKNVSLALLRSRPSVPDRLNPATVPDHDAPRDQRHWWRLAEAVAQGGRQHRFPFQPRGPWFHA